jgi:hypothetical protein
VTFGGIAIPSLLLVLAVRRWIAPLPWRIALLFLVLTLAFLHGAVFSSRLPVPVDEVARGYPYRGLFGDVHARNPLTNDTVKLFLPWMQVAREELLHGRLPLWNPYSFSGYPLLGNGESAPFSPLFLATLLVALPKQIVAMAGLKIFVALLFGYLFLKREEVSDAAACFGAAAFAFSVYQTTVLYYSAASVSALLPAALFAMDTASRRGIVLMAAVIATMLTSGHPESVFHIAVGATLLAAVDFALSPAKRDWLMRFRYPVIGAIAGAVLSAPAWLPTLQMIPLSTRYAAVRAAPPPAPLPLTALWALVTPNGFGHPLRHNWNWISNYTIVASSYVGLIVLALVIAGVFSRGATARDRWLAGLAVLLFVAAMDWSVIGRAVNALPLFSITANDKLRFVACFFAAVVAAKAVDRVSWLAYLGVTLPLAMLVIYVYAGHRSLMQPIDLLPVVLLLAVGALIRMQHGAAAALVATVVELFALNTGFNALVPAKYFRPELPIVEALRARAPHEPYRVAGFDWTFLPNASAQYGLEDIRGSDPMSLYAYTEFLKPLTRRDPTTDLDRLVVVDDPRLDFLGVRFLMAEPGRSFGPPWTLVYSGPDGTLFENARARPRFFAEGARIATEQPRPGQYVVSIEASRPVLVESSVPAAPGWRLVPRPVEVVHGAFVGFRVPAGRSRVELAYKPWKLWE